MYYVYSGYIGPDHYDASEGNPIYRLDSYETEEEVIRAKKEFDENLSEDDSHIEFRIIEGEEKSLMPKKQVIEWELS